MRLISVNRKDYNETKKKTRNKLDNIPKQRYYEIRIEET